MANKVRVDLASIDTWESLLGEINNDCMSDLKDISSIITGDLVSFKGTTAEKAKEIAEEIQKKANKAHDNLSNVQKSLVAVKEKAVSI